MRTLKLFIAGVVLLATQASFAKSINKTFILQEGQSDIISIGGADILFVTVKGIKNAPKGKWTCHTSYYVKGTDKEIALGLKRFKALAYLKARQVNDNSVTFNTSNVGKRNPELKLITKPNKTKQEIEVTVWCEQDTAVATSNKASNGTPKKGVVSAPKMASTPTKTRGRQTPVVSPSHSKQQKNPPVDAPLVPEADDNDHQPHWLQKLMTTFQPQWFKIPSLYGIK